MTCTAKHIIVSIQHLDRSLHKPFCGHHLIDNRHPSPLVRSLSGQLMFPPPLLGSNHSAQSADNRSEEHTSELQSLMRISYAVFCLKKKQKTYINKLQQERNTI